MDAAPQAAQAAYTEDLTACSHLWRESTDIVHAVQGARMVPDNPYTYLTWTRCGRDVRSQQTFLGSDPVTCPACLDPAQSTDNLAPRAVAALRQIMKWSADAVEEAPTDLDAIDGLLLDINSCAAGVLSTLPCTACCDGANLDADISCDDCGRLGAEATGTPEVAP